MTTDRAHPLFSLGVAVALLAQPLASRAHTLDFEPQVRKSPLIATPEAVRTDLRSGAATYRYPFEVSPGTGGLTPELALTYSSLTGNTEYGWGWSLGISKIERSTRFGPPTYDDAQDRFELDGSLLVPDPTQANRFHKEQNDFSRILYFPATKSWEVTLPNGTKLHYGSRPGAQSILADGPDLTGNVFRWALDRVVDARGNSYEIDYTADFYSIGATANHVSFIYPERIRYSLHPQAGASQGKRLVEFRWGPRGSTPEVEDRPTSYRSGFKIQIAQRLESIVVGLESGTFDGVVQPGERVREYQFSYAEKTSPEFPTNAPFSQLVNIQRLGSDGTPFPTSTRFSYVQGQGFLPPETWTVPTGFGPGVRHGFAGSITDTVVDMDGDGLPDLLRSSTVWQVWFGQPVGGFATTAYVWGWGCMVACRQGSTAALRRRRSRTPATGLSRPSPS